MFCGHDVYALDEHGKMPLPARWRDQLGPSVVITRGLDRCLLLYPGDKFGEMARKLERLTLGHADARAFTRYLFSAASDVTPDEHGRIAISSELLRFAGIESKAIVAGVTDRIEIWEPVRYAEIDAQVAAEANAVAERIGSAVPSL